MTNLLDEIISRNFSHWSPREKEQFVNFVQKCHNQNIPSARIKSDFIRTFKMQMPQNVLENMMKAAKERAKAAGRRR